MGGNGYASTWSDHAFSCSGMSIICWLQLKNESSPLLPVGDAPTSGANKEVEKADAQHRKKRGTYHHYMMKFELK